MLKNNGRSDNDLVNFYYSCILFKKYYQYNLWFGSSGEYDNIKYCKKYIQIYIYYWIHFFLLQRFSLSFVIFLYRSPCFIKFVESGFFKYLDYHFLLSFYNNCFTFDLKGKQKIKFFFKSYFQNFLKKRLKKDLFALVTKVINEIILNVLLKHLTNRLKYIQIYVEQARLDYKVPVKLVIIKREIYFIGLSHFNHLIKKSYYRLGFTDFSYLYELNLYYFFLSLKFVYKSLLKFINFKDKKILKFNLKPFKVNKLIMEKTFIGFPKKTLQCSNKDIQYLIESVETLGGFNGQEKNISLYKSSSIIFEPNLIQKLLLFKKFFKKFRLFLRSFNICFLKYKYKRKFCSRVLIRCNSNFSSEVSKKNFKSYFLKVKKKSITNRKKLSNIIKKRYIIKYKDSFIKDNIRYHYNTYMLYEKPFRNSIKTFKYLSN